MGAVVSVRGDGKDTADSSQQCHPCSSPSIFSVAFPSQQQQNHFEIYDLSHPLEEGMNVWPGKLSVFLFWIPLHSLVLIGVHVAFQHCVTCHPDYTSGSFTISEHCGTHVDAPYHFVKDGLTVDRIPLTQLITSVKVVDITAACVKDRDYQLSVTDLQAFEEKHSMLNSCDVLFIRTGWHIHWKEGNASYFGTSTVSNEAAKEDEKSASALSFPGISVEAAQLLVERGIKGVGLDSPSLDYGKSSDFAVHRLLLSNGIIGIENLNEEIVNLPPSGAVVMIMPLKIVGGSGSPARVITFVPK
jgi:kynurenine formamidase